MRTIALGLAAATVAGFALTAAPQQANAATFLESSFPSNRQCFVVTHRPQVVRVNTRGRLVRREGTTTAITTVHAGIGSAAIIRNPAVYMETRRVIERDHYSMRPAAC